MITIEKKDGLRFANVEKALMNLNGMQTYFAMAGYLTSSYICLETHRISLTVHLESVRRPRVPSGYQYSRYEINSQEYYSEIRKTSERIRTIEYQYAYED